MSTTSQNKVAVRLSPDWYQLLEEEFTKEYFKNLTDFVKNEYKNKIIYPKPKHIFRCLDTLPPEKVKVIILGQDPYHGEGQALGFSFSVDSGVALPPSLKNIFKELNHDLGIPERKSGDLSKWASQGVLLLNSTLTVQSNKAGSHQGIGWETFTDKIIEKLQSTRNNLVFVLWGNYAKQKEKLIDPNKHLVIKSAHPSPLSAYNGFFGSKPFSKTNQYLLSTGQTPIVWG